MPVDRASLVDFLSRIHLFRGIDTPKIEEAANLLEEVLLPAGATIFQQGDIADYFYFIFEGKLRVSRFDTKDRQFRQIGFLEKFDYFGQEVLETGWPRQIMVDTVSDVTILRLSIQNFVSLIEIIPALSQRLQMILDSYRLMLNTRFIWQDPEEMIYFIARRHIFFMLRGILPSVVFGLVTIPVLLFVEMNAIFAITPLVLLFICALITIVWFIWSYIDWTNDYYILTNRRVLFQEKVVLIYDSRQESPLDAVQSTSTNTSQTGRILGFGNVAIRTFIGTILFRDVPYPEQVMALIQEHQARTLLRDIYTEQGDIQKRISHRINSGPQLPPPPKVPKVQEKPSAMRQFLSTMFHLRYEVSGTVTFRKHWFILIQRIWMPSLLLIGLVVLFFVSAANQFGIFSPLVTIALLSLVGFIVFLWWIYQYADWHNDIYLITPEQVVDVYKKPLGRENRQAAPLKNILSIEYKRRGFFGLIFNYGTVFIRVGDQSLDFDDVYKPSEVQRELFDRLAKKNYQERQKSMEDERRRMADWIAGYNEWAKQSQPPRNPPPTRSGF